MSDRAALEREQHARALQENPLLAQLLDEQEADTTRIWLAAEDPAVRERCWYRIQAIEHLRVQLEMTIGAGKLSRARGRSR